MFPYRYVEVAHPEQRFIEPEVMHESHMEERLAAIRKKFSDQCSIWYEDELSIGVQELLCYIDSLPCPQIVTTVKNFRSMVADLLAEGKRLMRSRIRNPVMRTSIEHTRMPRRKIRQTPDEALVTIMPQWYDAHFMVDAESREMLFRFSRDNWHQLVKEMIFEGGRMQLQRGHKKQPESVWQGGNVAILPPHDTYERSA